MGFDTIEINLVKNIRITINIRQTWRIHTITYYTGIFTTIYTHTVLGQKLRKNLNLGKPSTNQEMGASGLL